MRKFIHMKFKIIILVLILTISCKKNTENEFYEINLTDKTVVGIIPDSTQVEELIKKFGEDDFSIIVDDVNWYDSQIYEVLDSLKINYINTDKRYIRITTPKDQMKVNNDTSRIKWRYIYFDGIKISEKDVFEIIDLDKLQE